MRYRHPEDQICTYISGDTLITVNPTIETAPLIHPTDSQAKLYCCHGKMNHLPFVVSIDDSSSNTMLPLQMNQLIGLLGKTMSGKEERPKTIVKHVFRLGKEIWINQTKYLFPQGHIYPYIIEDTLKAVHLWGKMEVCTDAEAKLLRNQIKKDYLTHIFAIAQSIYQSTLHPTMSQCISLIVESESRKTERANFWIIQRAAITKENLQKFSQSYRYLKLGFESQENISKYQMPPGKAILEEIESKELNNIKKNEDVETTKKTKEEASSFLRTAKSTFKINPNLVLLKCALFLYFGGISAVNPFYTVLMRNIGLTIEEIGIISACLPFAALFGAPIAGMLSDKLGQYRYVLIGTLICAIISQTCTLFADARTPDPFESHNSSAILYNSYNETHLRLISGSWNSTKPLAAVRFKIPYDGNSYECVTAEKPINFDVIEERGHILIGNADVNLTRCVLQIDVEITALKVVDMERDREHQLIHLRGFWTFFFIRVIANAMTSSCFVLFDAIVLSMVKEHNGDYGKQRFFSMLGLGSISPLSGILVDWFSAIKGSRDYSVIFYFSDAFLVIVILLVWKLDVKAEKTQGSFLKNLQQLITIPEIPVFLFFMVLLGSNWGLTDSYLFIFLTDELNAPVSLLGLSITVGCFCGLPFLSISNQIIKKVGIMPMFLLAYLAHAARFIGYSFLQDPWITLAIESLKFLSYHLLQCAACNFCSLKAPKGLLATLTSIFGVSHYHLGRSAGAYSGGLLISQYGVRESFRIFAYAAILIGTSYMLIEFLILRRIARRRDLREKEKENEDHEAPFLSAQSTGA